MKKTLLLGFFTALLLTGYQVAYAQPLESNNQDVKRDNQSSQEKSDGIDEEIPSVDSARVMYDNDEPEMERRIAPEQTYPQQTEPSQKPAEDQSDAVSSFNFFYYLIEKIKFPDLLDESF